MALIALNKFLYFILKVNQSLIESIFYVISTYTFPEVSSSQITINKNIQQSEIIFLVYFIAHFALRFYCSQNKILFLLNIVNFIDLASSICLILAQQDFSQDQSSQYFFRMFRIFRLGYLARLEHIVQKKTEERMRLLYRIIINSVSILFIVMAVFLELENNNIRENYEPRELLAMLTVSLCTLVYVAVRITQKHSHSDRDGVLVLWLLTS